MREKSTHKGSPIIPIILSAICAIALWMYVMSVESPIYSETFSAIPIELRNSSVLTQSKLSVVSGTGYTVDVTVNGRRSAINQIRPEKIVAYVDLAAISAAGEYALEVKTEPIDGVAVSGLSENTVMVYADVTTTKTISISQDIVYHGGITTEAGYSMGTPYIVPTTTMPDVTTTTISGPISALNTVDHACVKAIDIGAITIGASTGSIVHNDGVLQLVGENGEIVDNPYIKGSGVSVTVNFPIIMEKAIDVEPKFSQSYTAADYTISVTPSRVTVRGEKSVVSSLDKITFPIDGTPETHIGETKVDLTLEGIEILDEKTTATMTVRKNPAKAEAK